MVIELRPNISVTSTRSAFSNEKKRLLLNHKGKQPHIVYKRDTLRTKHQCPERTTRNNGTQWKFSPYPPKWLKWGKGPGYTTHPWTGLNEPLINKLCSVNTSIKAHVLFVLSTFSSKGLFGNLDLLFPDNGPAVRTSEGTLSVYLPAHQGSEMPLDPKDTPCLWLAAKNRRLMVIWHNDSRFPLSRAAATLHLSWALCGWATCALLVLMNKDGQGGPGGSSGATGPLVEG